MQTIEFIKVLESVVNLEVVEGKAFATIEDFENNFASSEDDIKVLKAFAEIVKPASPNLFRLYVSGGTYKTAYGPSIFKTEPTEAEPVSKLVCICGENTWDVSVKGMTFALAGMEGELQTFTHKDKEYPAIHFESEDGEYNFVMPLRTLKKEDGTEWTRAELKQLLKKGLADLLPMISPVPKDRGTLISLPELGECEVDLLGIEKTTSQFGDKWFLTLPNGYYARTNTALNKQLSKSEARVAKDLEAGKPYCIKISGINVTSNGNNYCQATIYNRPADPNKAPAIFGDKPSDDKGDINF